MRKKEGSLGANWGLAGPEWERVRESERPRHTAYQRVCCVQLRRGCCKGKPDALCRRPCATLCQVQSGSGRGPAAVL